LHGGATAVTAGWLVAAWNSAAVHRTTILLCTLALWEAISRLGVVDPIFLPPPSTIVLAVTEIFDDPRAVAAFRVTGLELGLSFVIAAVLGLAIGIPLGLNRFLRDAFLPPILFLLSTPKAIFLPIFLILFGIGVDSKIAYGAFSAFFYIVDNVVGGVGLLEAKRRRLARAFGAPLRHYLVDIVIPSALPGIFAGMWHGLRQALAAVLVAELFASDSGVGYMVRIYTNQFRTDKTLALVAVVSLLVIVAGSLFNRLEVRMNRWRAVAHT